MKKLLFICQPGLTHFLTPLLQALHPNRPTRLHLYRPETDADELDQALDWAQLVWFEWGNRPLIELSHSSRLARHTVICRIHSYEALDGSLAAVHWPAVHHAIFVARHVQELALRLNAGLRVHPIPHWIPNAADGERFPLQPHQPGTEWAFVGDINHKKGLPLLLQAFAYLARRQPGIRLHLAGRLQDLRFASYLEHWLAQTGLQQQVTHHGWVEDMPGWLASKDHLISCSPWESQGMAIMEAMLCGIRPLIHHFVGAEAIYPRQLLWQTLDQLPDLLANDAAADWRTWILERFGPDRVYPQIEALLARCDGS